MMQRISKIVLCLRDRHVFCVTITGDFERVQCFNYETSFLRNENIFPKTGVPFLVKSIKIESTTFPTSEAKL